MSENKLPNAIWEGSFNIFGVELKCYILEDGRRIVGAGSLDELFNKFLDEDKPLSKTDQEELNKFLIWQKKKPN